MSCQITSQDFVSLLCSNETSCLVSQSLKSWTLTFRPMILLSKSAPMGLYALSNCMPGFCIFVALSWNFMSHVSQSLELWTLQHSPHQVLQVLKTMWYTFPDVSTLQHTSSLSLYRLLMVSFMNIGSLSWHLHSAGRTVLEIQCYCPHPFSLVLPLVHTELFNFKLYQYI